MCSSRVGSTWLLIIGCGVVGLIAVLHRPGAPPAEPPEQPSATAGPSVLSRPIPRPLPGESATGGAPTGELSEITRPGSAPVAASTAPGPDGIPGALFAGYRHAEQELAITAPRCHLGWPALAAVGRAVSGHARGGQVDDRGRTVARLLGPKLSGSVGRRQLPDSDRGRWDGDADRDRAVGPMQIVPSVWRRYSATENADPDSVGDAAVTAGRYLCAGDVDLSRPTALRAAIARYSASDSFVSSVLAAERDYRIATGSDPLAPPEPRPVAPLAPPAVTPAPTVPAEVPLPAARPNVVVSPTPGAEIVAGAPADRVAARVGATAGAPASESSGYGGRGSR